MNKEEVKMCLQKHGMKKDYRAQWDSEDGRGVIAFAVRGKFAIEDGILRGTRIILADGLITVWTAKTKKAREFCKSKGIRMREMTGECEFSLPASYGDEFLTDWGARIRLSISPERKAQMAEALKSSILRSKTPRNDAPQE